MSQNIDLNSLLHPDWLALATRIFGSTNGRCGPMAALRAATVPGPAQTAAMSDVSTLTEEDRAALLDELADAPFDIAVSALPNPLPPEARSLPLRLRLAMLRLSAFCEAYTAERNRLAAAATSTRGTMEKELGTTKRDHAKLVDAIIAGVPADQVKNKMMVLDARRKELEAQLSQVDASLASLRLHPTMSQTYRERVTSLIRGLADSEGMEEAREAVRGLIEKFVLTPREDGPGLTMDLHGALASLLLLATGAPVQRVARMGFGAQNDKSSAGAELQGIDFIDKTVLVAEADNRRSRPALSCKV